MKKGETIKVFQDPITCKDFEGYAKLIEPKPKKRDIQGLTETWLVEFEDGTKVERTIIFEIKAKNRKYLPGGERRN